MAKRDLETNTFHYHNANSKGKTTTDCVIRAICTALEIPYVTVLKDLVEIQIKTGYHIGDVRCYGKYLEEKGWHKRKQPRKWNGKKYTGTEWCEELNDDAYMEGKTIVTHIGGHHVVCVMQDEHGKFKAHDIWDCTERCVGNYWARD